ncbi:hypothetical protein VBK72_23090 [Enterobacter hormaechei]|nr:hypothetical protein [Enterobacter hormaechei]
MTKEMFLRILNEAQARVDNDSLPLDVRIRSRTTVNDCVIRADKEGWPIEYKQKVWVDAVALLQIVGGDKLIIPFC